MAKKNKRRDRKGNAVRNQAILLVVTGLVTVGAIFLLTTGSDSDGSAPPVVESRLELDPILGNPDAPVTIIEYGAYGCTSCRAWHQARIIDQILAEYPNQVRFIFRDFPVIYPSYDHMAAGVAQCALDQSEDGFWVLHNALYTTIPIGSSQETILQMGEQFGLNGDALRACVEQDTHRATVQYDEDRARRLALPGTPSFLVNDVRIFNATPDILAEAIVQALASS